MKSLNYLTTLYFALFTFLYLVKKNGFYCSLGSQHKRVEWPVGQAFSNYISGSCDYGILYLFQPIPQ